MTLTPPPPCPQCQGTGMARHESIAAGKRIKCRWCGGKGEAAQPDERPPRKVERMRERQVDR